MTYKLQNAQAKNDGVFVADVLMFTRDTGKVYYETQGR